MSTEVRTRTYQSILLILFGLLLLLNVAAFLIYREAHAAESLSLQLWNYINSDAFKLLSASLILPIILFVLESKFKLAETVSKNLSLRVAPLAPLVITPRLCCRYQANHSAATFVLRA